MYPIGRCYTNDGSIAAAVVYRAPDGLRLHVLSEILGMGLGGFEEPIGPTGAVQVTTLSSTHGAAWVHICKETSASLVHLQDGKTLPMATVTNNVSLNPVEAFAEVGLPITFKKHIPDDLMADLVTTPAGRFVMVLYRHPIL